MESVFDTSADHPTPLGLAAVEGRQERGVRGRQTVFVARPRAAALAVEEDAIERDAQPARDRADALDLDLAVRRRKRAVEQRGRRARAAAGEICAADIRLHAEYQGTGLVGGSDLAAAEPSADVDRGRCRRDGVGQDAIEEAIRGARLVRAAPAAAHVAAEVKAGPAEEHHG